MRRAYLPQINKVKDKDKDKDKQRNGALQLPWTILPIRGATTHKFARVPIGPCVQPAPLQPLQENKAQLRCLNPHL
jgi:hypothetical protein